MTKILEHQGILLERKKQRTWLGHYELLLLIIKFCEHYSLLMEYHQLKDQMKAAMCEVYYEDSIEEWIEVNLDPRIVKLQEVIDKAESQLQLHKQYSRRTAKIGRIRVID